MTFTFTQADVEKLIEDHLAKKNFKVVGKYHPNKHDNTVSVDVEELTPEVKTATQKLQDMLKEAKISGSNIGICRQCMSERLGRPEKGICSCQYNPNTVDPSWIR
jgi:hypothetical protein